MQRFVESRREFLRTTGLAAGAVLFSPKHLFAAGAGAAADYTVRIKAAPIEIAPNQILSTITYNSRPNLSFGLTSYVLLVTNWRTTSTPSGGAITTAAAKA